MDDFEEELDDDEEELDDDEEEPNRWLIIVSILGAALEYCTLIPHGLLTITKLSFQSPAITSKDADKEGKDGEEYEEGLLFPEFEGRNGVELFVVWLLIVDEGGEEEDDV